MKHKNATATGRHLSHAVILAILATCAGDFYAQNSQTPTAPPREPEASLDDTVIPAAILSPQRPLPAEPSTGSSTAAPEAAGPDDQSLLGREQLTGNWWGARTKLADMGIVPAASFTSDAAMNFRGGQNTAGSSFLHLTDVNLTLTSPLLPVAGSSVFLSFQHVNGTSPSEDVGDVQGVSSIDSDGRTQLSEAWYKQEFVDGKLAVTLGKIDAGSTMGLVEPEGYFINGYLGFQGVIPMPTYPDPSFGLQIMAAPTDRLTLDAGIYDGAL